MRNNYIVYAIALILLSLTIQVKAKTKDKPNIILILTDDQGYGDVGRHGNTEILTPHINRLHDQSVRFSNFVVSPTCAPTRCALMTGKHEFKSGVSHTVSGRREMSLQSTTIAQVLKSGGYTTGIFGKWHLGSEGLFRPEKRGFDQSLTTVDDTQNSHFDPVLLYNGVEKKTKGFRTDILFDKAIQFIESNKDKPFFCYIPTYSPHTPIKAPQKYIDRYNGNVFYGMISNIDDNVGRLMETVDKLQLDNNTIVIFINDNGATKGTDIYNAGMRGCKATPWFGGSRAISYWRWSNHLVPREISQLAGHIDLLPSLADFTNTKLKRKLKHEIDGVSLKPILQNKTETLTERMIISHVGRWPSGEGKAETHKYAFCSVHYNDFLLVKSLPCNDANCKGECRVFRGINDGTRSSIYTQKNGKFHYALTHNREWMLYNIKNDPAQEIDLAKVHPKILTKMSNRYENWWNDVFKYIY